MRTSQSGRWVTAELMDHLSSLLSSPTAGRHCWLRIIHYDGSYVAVYTSVDPSFFLQEPPCLVIPFINPSVSKHESIFQGWTFLRANNRSQMPYFLITSYIGIVVYFNVYFIVHFSDIIYSWYTFSVHNHRQSIELRIINVKLVHSAHRYETDASDSCNVHFWQTLRHCIWQ